MKLENKFDTMINGLSKLHPFDVVQQLTGNFHQALSHFSAPTPFNPEAHGRICAFGRPAGRPAPEMEFYSG